MAPLSGARGRGDSGSEVQAIFQDPYGSFNPFYKVEHALIEPLVHRSASPTGGAKRSTPMEVRPASVSGSTLGRSSAASRTSSPAASGNG